ncbi:MAG: flagellar biosynthesis protein FlhB [Methylomicrobium sp.]
MAEDAGQDKTEEPTDKRLSDARDKGQIARSRELNTFVMLITCSALFLMMGSHIGQGLIDMMQSYFSVSREVIFSPDSPVVSLKQAVIDAILLIAPFLGITVIAALIGPIGLSGWVFSWEAVQPKFEKLDPIKGLARLFSIRGLIELVKALLKFLLVFGVAIGLYRHYLNEFVGLSAEPLEQAIEHALNVIGLCFLILSATLILIVMFDVPYQLWSHHEQLKMTRQEVRDEAKETQGNPEIKGRQRRIQMEMAQRRMMQEVPKADVIVTNPTHYAVALKYDQNSADAPRVIAKGVDLVAAQIRQLAEEANIPLLAAPPLARALYHSTELNEEIPRGLFLAVAQVLAYVYQLKTARTYGWDEPLPPQDLPVPEEYRND